MQVFLTIILGLVSVWLDIALASWWPIWLIPIWIWVGISVTVVRSTATWRWLWILSVAAWSLFVVPISQVLIMVVVFGVLGEIFNIINKKYLPVGNNLIALIASFFLLSVGAIPYMFATTYSIGWSIVGRICITIVVTALITIFYGTKKDKKKHF